MAIQNFCPSVLSVYSLPGTYVFGGGCNSVIFDKQMAVVASRFNVIKTAVLISLKRVTHGTPTHTPIK